MLPKSKSRSTGTPLGDHTPSRAEVGQKTAPNRARHKEDKRRLLRKGRAARTLALPSPTRTPTGRETTLRIYRAVLVAFSVREV